MNRICPKCKQEGDVFINHSDYMAVECISCHIAWKEYNNGNWKIITDQDYNTMEVITTDSLLVWDEEQV
jgi:hypothetical protein